MTGQSDEQRGGPEFEFSLPSQYCGRPTPACPHTKDLACEATGCRWFAVGHQFFDPDHRRDPGEQPRCEFFGVNLEWKEMPLSGWPARPATTRQLDTPDRES